MSFKTGSFNNTKTSFLELYKSPMGFQHPYNLYLGFMNSYADLKSKIILDKRKNIIKSPKESK